MKSWEHVGLVVNRVCRFREFWRLSGSPVPYIEYTTFFGGIKVVVIDILVTVCDIAGANHDCLPGFLAPRLVLQFSLRYSRRSLQITSPAYKPSGTVRRISILFCCLATRDFCVDKTPLLSVWFPALLPSSRLCLNSGLFTSLLHW